MSEDATETPKGEVDPWRDLKMKARTRADLPTETEDPRARDCYTRAVDLVIRERPEKADLVALVSHLLLDNLRLKHPPGSPQNPHQPGTAENPTQVYLFESIHFQHFQLRRDGVFICQHLDFISLAGIRFLSSFHRDELPGFTFIPEVRK